MIVIKIEMWPKGEESKKYPLGGIAIYNDATGSDVVGNYYFASVGRGGQKYKSGEIKGFPRKRLLVFDLLFRCLREMVGERN